MCSIAFYLLISVNIEIIKMMFFVRYFELITRESIPKVDTAIRSEDTLSYYILFLYNNSKIIF